MSDKLGLGTWRMCHFDWYGYEVLWHAFFQTKNNRDPLQLLSVGDSFKLQWPGSVCVPVSEQVSPSVWRSGTGDRGDSSDEGHCPGNRWEQKYVKTFHYFSNWREVRELLAQILMFWISIAGRGIDKIKADAQEKGDLGLVAEVWGVVID